MTENLCLRCGMPQLACWTFCDLPFDGSGCCDTCQHHEILTPIRSAKEQAVLKPRMPRIGPVVTEISVAATATGILAEILSSRRPPRCSKCLEEGHYATTCQRAADRVAT